MARTSKRKAGTTVPEEIVRLTKASKKAVEPPAATKKKPASVPTPKKRKPAEDEYAEEPEEAEAKMPPQPLPKKLKVEPVKKQQAPAPNKMIDDEAEESGDADSEASSGEEEELLTPGPDGQTIRTVVKKPNKPRVFLSTAAMETLVNPKTKAYQITLEDLQCPRQLRMFAVAARRDEQSPYVKNGNIEVETKDGEVFPLPLNGRQAPRYPGASKLRGRVLLQSATKAGINAYSPAFFKDFGYGAKTSKALLESAGRSVRSATEERNRMLALLEDPVKDLEQNDLS